MQRSGQMNQPEKWGIIGGGIMGLSLAKQLSRAGRQAVVIESAPEIGGLTASWQLNGHTWDKFYHVILPDDGYTRDLIDDLQLTDKLRWKETRTGFYVDDNYYSISSLMEFLKFPPINLWDKFRLGLTILAGSYSNNWEKLEQIPVTTWLTRWSGKKTFNKIWLPLLKAKLGTQYAETSAAFIITTIQRLYKARKKGSKKEVFGYVDGGYATILDAFKKKLLDQNVAIHTHAKVREVLATEDGKVLIRMDDGNTHLVDKAIVTLPAPLAAKICRGLAVDETRKLNDIKYLGMICMSCILKLPLKGFYVTNIADDQLPFTGVIEMTALVDRKHFGGNSLVYLPKYVSSEDPLFQATDEEITSWFLASFAKMYPELNQEDILAYAVARARHVIALPVMNYSGNVHQIRTSLPGIYIVNSALITDGTLNVNETLKIALNSLEQILSNTNH
jgi:protoporphyrinogen oxidase